MFDLSLLGILLTLLGMLALAVFSLSCAFAYGGLRAYRDGHIEKALLAGASSLILLAATTSDLHALVQTMQGNVILVEKAIERTMTIVGAGWILLLLGFCTGSVIRWRFCKG